MEMDNRKNYDQGNRIDNTDDQNDEDSKLNTESMVSQRITIAGGFLDVALFVADVEHLKFIFDTGRNDVQYYDLLLGLLFSSLTLQILVGILLFVVGFGKNIQTLSEAKWSRIVNHTIIGLVSLIAIINIFVTVFGDRGETMTRFKERHVMRNITDQSFMKL